MPIYVFIDANNLGREMLYFEQDPDDLTPFIESQCMIFNELTMQAVKIQPQHKIYGIGLIYNGTEFRPPQPYPSWIWDEEKLFWRPPVLHPDVWPYAISNPSGEENYTWNEATQTWDPIA
jgi:hypothetical protein